MGDITLRIDGKDVTARDGMTLLAAARDAGVTIPTLCHHDALEPFGGCRLCIVEVEQRGWAQIVVACVYQASDGLVVRTRSEQIDRLRKSIIELLMAHAPESPQLVALASEYGAQGGRFPREPDFCIHCGLCVRYCAEVKKKDAVGFIDRGVRKEIAFVPEIAARECDACKECFPLCPTSYAQATYVLTAALAFPPAQSHEGPVTQPACDHRSSPRSERRHL